MATRRLISCEKMKGNDSKIYEVLHYQNFTEASTPEGRREEIPSTKAAELPDGTPLTPGSEPGTFEIVGRPPIVLRRI